MMSIKGGTQTWSTAAQKADYKSDGAQTVSATDQKKFFDGEDVGDTLNKVADPNYVNSSKKMRTVGDASMGKDAFMTLLLTQMKNQDPTTPLKSHEMAAQLAQFTSLEKLNNINDGINNLRKDNQPDHNFQALAFIGKTVTMDNSKIARMDAGESHDLRFALPQDAQKANIEVKDANGNLVRKMEMKNLKAGANSIAWNGKTDEGAAAPIGDYTLSVEAFASNGHKLAAQTKADGVVTGVNFTAHGAQLLMGKQVISMADVKSISDSSVGQKDLQTLAPPQAMPQGMPPGAMAQIAAQMGMSATPPGAAGGPGAPQSNNSRIIPLPPAAQMAQAAQARQANPAAQGDVPVESPKKVEVKSESKGNQAKRASLAKGNINDASMSQGLINRLNKEGAKAGM